MTYKPAIGISCILASIVADVLLGRTGAIFLVTLFIILGWSQSETKRIR